MKVALAEEEEERILVVPVLDQQMVDLLVAVLFLLLILSDVSDPVNKNHVKIKLLSFCSIRSTFFFVDLMNNL